jgi:predicted dehydrogenase
VLERVLIVGLGSIGARHARVARLVCPGVHIVALRHRATDDSREVVDAQVTTVEAALATRPQAAVIASPATHHIGVALALARAGVPLLVEKPLAADTDGVTELITTCAERGVPLLVGYNLRYLPSLQRFHADVRAGRVGRVLSVRAEVGQYLPSWRPGQDYRQSVSARQALGGGVLLELSHELDYLRWLCGDVVWVSAIVVRQSDLEIDVEDTAHLTLGFAPDDAGRSVVASVSLDFIRHDTTRQCTVIGAEGSLRWTAATGRVEWFGRGASAWQTVSEEASERDATYLAEWREFVACINSSRSPQVTGEDGRAVLEVIAAARRSAASGRVEQVA